MVVYEGPAEGLLEKVAELGGKKVRLEVVEEPSRKPFDREEHERIHRRFAELTAGKPVPDRILTAEDFYADE